MSKCLSLLFTCASMLFWFNGVQALAMDPTRPLGYSHVVSVGGDVESEPIFLTSILIRGESKIAIINGQQLHEGQSVKGNGAEIKRIDVESVTLQQGKKVWRVLLNKTVIRK